MVDGAGFFNTDHSKVVEDEDVDCQISSVSLSK